MKFPHTKRARYRDCFGLILDRHFLPPSLDGEVTSANPAASDPALDGVPQRSRAFGN